MKDFLKVTTLTTFLLVIPFHSFSQPSYSCEDTYFSIQAGSGVNYGGYVGVMAALKVNSAIGIYGAIGQYSGPPLSFGFFDDDTKLTKETQSGLGYSIGMKIFYPNDDFYTGIQYINAGKLKDKNSEKEAPLPGINLTLLGGSHLIKSSRIFIDWGLNLAFVFKDGVEGETVWGGIFGISLGLGYVF